MLSTRLEVSRVRAAEPGSVCCCGLVSACQRHIGELLGFLWMRGGERERRPIPGSGRTARLLASEVLAAPPFPVAVLLGFGPEAGLPGTSRGDLAARRMPLRDDRGVPQHGWSPGRWFPCSGAVLYGRASPENQQTYYEKWQTEGQCRWRVPDPSPDSACRRARFGTSGELRAGLTMRRDVHTSCRLDRHARTADGRR